MTSCNKIVCGMLFLFAGLSASATTFKTNTVDGLVYLLQTYNGKSHVIELAPGDYSLGSVQMWTAEVSGAEGPAQLYVNTIRIKGTGATCDSTRLIGSGNCRAIFGGGAVLENLTVTNGCAKKVSGSGNADRGGAVFGSITATNCLFIGNSSQGYGGAFSGGTVAYDCRFVNNTAPNGGAAHQGSYYNSVFCGNQATGEGGAAYNVTRIIGSILTNNTATYGGAVRINCEIKNSLIANNSAQKGGGLFPNEATGGFCQDSVISNNTATIEGGGCKNGSYSNCTFIANTAPKGAAGYIGVYRHCTIVGNRGTDTGILTGDKNNSVYNTFVYDSFIASNRNESADGSAAMTCYVSNCFVYANFGTCSTASSYAGGVRKSTVYDSEIAGNYCEATGSNHYGASAGASDSTLYNCYVHDNYSSNFGGGVRASKCYNCRIENNAAGGMGPNAMSADLFDCTVKGSGVYAGSATRTKFIELKGTITVENPYLATKAQTLHYLSQGSVAFTNCLICGSAGLDTIFRGNTTVDADSSVVNCTIVSNTADRMFSLYATSAHPLRVENSIFFDNFRNATVRSDTEIEGNCVGGLFLDRCAYGVNTCANLSNYIVSGGKLYKFGEADGIGEASVGSKPRFCLDKDPENPYSLLHSSKVRGLATYRAWMANATDIRGAGFPRADGTSADLGCYQCWRPADGLLLLFR